MPKLKNIEFLRFIFTIIIVIFHLVSQPNTLFANFPDLYINLHTTSFFGYVCVEFFFIIAGFFLFFTAKKDINFKQFAENRFIRLWFVPAFAIFCIWIESLFKISDFNKYADILHLFMLKNTGITLCLADNGTTWFISVLFWVGLFYFYLIKNYHRKNVMFAVALIVFFSYVMLVNGTKGSFGAHYIMLNSIFNVGMLRGLGGMGIGLILAGCFEQKLENIEQNTKISIKSLKDWSFWVCSFAEVYLLVFLVNNLLFHKIKFQNDMLFIIIFVCLFTLFLLKKGILSNILDNKLSVYLGKYCFSIYVMQEVVYRILAKTLWVTPPPHEQTELMLLVSLGITIIVGIITYYLVEKNSIKLRKYIK